LPDPALSIRVGVHMGQVVVQAIENTLYQTYDATGVAVHLASRLRGVRALEARVFAHGRATPLLAVAANGVVVRATALRAGPPCLSPSAYALLSGWMRGQRSTLRPQALWVRPIPYIFSN